jgi:flagellar hook-associated protein FlgK
MYPVSLNIAGSGLRAQQQILETASKNIANAEVPGYKRQEVRTSTVPNNGGVETSVSVNYAPWADAALTSASIDLSKKTAIQEGVERLDNLISNNNIEQTYSDFLTASKNLQTFPDAVQYLTEFNKTGAVLNNSFNQVSESIQELEQQTKNKINLNQMQLDSLKNQLTQISSSGINETNAGNVQLLQQQIASLTGTIGGYNEFINKIVPPIIINYNSVIDKTKAEMNNAVGAAMFTSDKKWMDVSKLDTTNLNNNESVIEFGDQFGSVKTAAGIATNAALLDVKFYTNKFDAASKEWNAQYGVNLEKETVKVMNAQRLYEANAKMIKASDSMIGSLLDAIG